MLVFVDITAKSILRGGGGGDSNKIRTVLEVLVSERSFYSVYNSCYHSITKWMVLKVSVNYVYTRLAIQNTQTEQKYARLMSHLLWVYTTVFMMFVSDSDEKKGYK